MPSLGYIFLASGAHSRFAYRTTITNSDSYRHPERAANLRLPRLSRPRESGDPYAVSSRCGKTYDKIATKRAMGPRFRGDDWNWRIEGFTSSEVLAPLGEPLSGSPARGPQPRLATQDHGFAETS